MKAFIIVASLALVQSAVAQFGFPGRAGGAGAGAASSFLASNPQFNSASQGVNGGSSWATSGGLGAENLARQTGMQNMGNAQASQFGTMNQVNGMMGPSAVGGAPSQFYPGANSAMGMAGANPGMGMAGVNPGMGMAGVNPGMGMAGANPGLGWGAGAAPNMFG